MKCASLFTDYVGHHHWRWYIEFKPNLRCICAAKISIKIQFVQRTQRPRKGKYDAKCSLDSYFGKRYKASENVSSEQPGNDVSDYIAASSVLLKQTQLFYIIAFLQNAEHRHQPF